jgi:hypothetical protein
MNPRSFDLIESKSERIPRSLLWGLAPSIYELNRECWGLASD